LSNSNVAQYALWFACFRRIEINTHVRTLTLELRLTTGAEVLCSFLCVSIKQSWEGAFVSLCLTCYSDVVLHNPDDMHVE
jgi:hypothetical protein